MLGQLKKTGRKWRKWRCRERMKINAGLSLLAKFRDGNAGKWK